MNPLQRTTTLMNMKLICITWHDKPKDKPVLSQHLYLNIHHTLTDLYKNVCQNLNLTNEKLMVFVLPLEHQISICCEAGEGCIRCSGILSQKNKKQKNIYKACKKDGGYSFTFIDWWIEINKCSCISFSLSVKILPCLLPSVSLRCPDLLFLWHRAILLGRHQGLSPVLSI